MDIYRIVDRETDEEIGVYMPPTARDEYNFNSIKAARESNCHGIYKDKAKYKIRKYKLVLVDDDCDPPSEQDFIKSHLERDVERKRRELMSEIALEIYGKSLAEIELEQYFKVASVAAVREFNGCLISK